MALIIRKSKYHLINLNVLNFNGIIDTGGVKEGRFSFVRLCIIQNATDGSMTCNHQRVIEAHKRQKETPSGDLFFFFFSLLLIIIIIIIRVINLNGAGGRA